MIDEAEKFEPYPKDEKGRFQSGNIGGGRPPGSRNKLGEAFIEALSDDFAAHGVKAIETVRTEKPDQYLRVIAGLLPKDLNINVNQMDGLTDEQLIERIRALDATIRPFLELERAVGGSDGTSAPTAH
jgi:hypothetical protein